MYHPDTDDADDLGLSYEFASDECIARDDDEWDYHHASYKCGGPCYEYGQNTGCQGCKHCYPPDFDCKPMGFGIERSEDPALHFANEWLHRPEQRATLRSDVWIGHPINGTTYRQSERNRVWALNSVQSKLRERASDTVWYRLCDECDTHPEAVAKYKAWAKHALTVRCKDEPRIDQ